MKSRTSIFVALTLSCGFQPVLANPSHCPSPASVEAFARGQAQPVPTFAGRRLAVDPPKVKETAHFAILYQVAGPHAVSGAGIDADANGHPDNIDSIGVFAERVWRLAIDTMGYLAPPGRDSAAGYKIRVGKNHKYLIEVGDMPTFSTNWVGGGFLGFTVSTNLDPDKLGGSELVLENDFLDTGKTPITVKVDPVNTAHKTDSILYDYSKDPLKGWAVTLAHEFYHAVQFQYDASY